MTAFTAANQPPIAADDAFTIVEGAPRLFTPAELLDNDRNPDDDSLAIVAAR